MPHRLPMFVLALADAVALFVALGITLLVRYGPQAVDAPVWRTHFYAFAPLFMAWLAVFALAGLYEPSIFAAPTRWWRTLLLSISINFSIAAITFYFLPALRIAPKTNLFLVIGLSAALLFLWRSVLLDFWRAPRWLLRAALIGTREEIDLALRDFRGSPGSGFSVHVLCAVDESDTETLVRFPRYALEKGIEAVILTEGMRKRQDVMEMAGECLGRGLQVIDGAALTVELAKKVPLRYLSTIWVLEHFAGAKHRFADFAKRSADIAMAVAAGIVFLSLLPAIALAVRLIDGRPVFYQQVRVGKDRKLFTLRKFRTMHHDAEQEGVRWADSYDSRITRLGGFLRRTHLDELPQLWNILRGEMSFAGPRPERPEFASMLEARVPFYHLRHLVRPGLTGWAQINYPYASTLEESMEKLEYDLYYVKNRSLWLDAVILARTGKALFGLGPR